MTSLPASRIEYFDSIAPRWEALVDAARIRGRLSPVLDELAIGADEHILDLGCGTGILTGLVLPRLSAHGRVSAVDFSGAMLDLAREKLPDRRVMWIASDATLLPLPRAGIDRAIAFSTWPHFPDPPDVLREIRRVVRPGGMFHIIHVDSRSTINGIHRQAGGAIGHDLLPPARELAELLVRFGFRVLSLVDDEERYTLNVTRDLLP